MMKGRIIKIMGEREYHDKTIRTYYTNKDVKKLKPFQRVKDALKAERQNT